MEIDMSKYISPYHKMTEEIRIKILELWQKEMSGGEIASQLGISRNSVIGVVYRAKQNGESLRGSTFKKQKIKSVKTVKEKVSKEVVQKVKQIKEKKKIEKICNPVEPVETPESYEVTMDGLMHYSCRFIVKEGNYETTKYCGKNKDQSSYCKEHYTICYTPTRFSLQRLLSS
jgi:hypothetical protein